MFDRHRIRWPGLRCEAGRAKARPVLGSLCIGLSLLAVLPDVGWAAPVDASAPALPDQVRTGTAVPIQASVPEGPGLKGDVVPSVATPRSAPSGFLAGHFHLATPEGRIVDNLEFADKPYALFFGFTHCPNVCPTVLSDISSAMQKVTPAAVESVGVYFVSIDPERDTPSAMAEYMKSFDPRITALTGSRQDVDEAAASFGATVKRFSLPDADYSFSHAASVFLVDGNGIIVDTISMEAGVDALASKLTALAKPAQRVSNRRP